MRFFFLELFSRLDTVDSRLDIRVVSWMILPSFCFRSFMSSASCCSFLVVVAFMSSKFLHKWSSYCFMSEMSESRCFGAMVVGGVKMLLGSDGGKSNGRCSVQSVRLYGNARRSLTVAPLSRSMSDNTDAFTQNEDIRSQFTIVRFFTCTLSVTMLSYTFNLIQVSIKTLDQRINSINAVEKTRDETSQRDQTLKSWGQDYKRFSSMDWCSTHTLCSEMT